MKCHHYKLCSLLMLFKRLFSTSFQLPPTVAFAHKRIDFTRIQSRADTDTSFRCASSNHDDTYFGQGGNDDAEERQDAYGRTIRKDCTSDETDGPSDPLATTASTTTTSTNPQSIPMTMNLDPLVVCGPSGVGKGTVIESLRTRFPPDVFGFSVSHTTRQPRPGELHGQHYYFTSREEIQTDIDQGSFVEHAEVHGNYYGTSKQAIEVLQNQQKITILDIDMQGVISVKESGISAKFVFIAPPSLQELEDRLRGRGTETEEAIRKRLGNAEREIEYGEGEGNFDRVFVNENVEQTVDEMVKVLSEWFPQLKSTQDFSADASGPKGEPTPQDQQQQQKAPAESSSPPPVQQPFDFLAESDRMLKFPSVRKGHGRLVMAPDDMSPAERRQIELNTRHMGAYTVDLEEADDGHPRLGNTNPNIVLDGGGFGDNSLAGTPNTKNKQQQQQQQRGMFTAGRSTEKEKQAQDRSESSYFVDNEEPDGPRGYPRLGKTNPTTLLDSGGSNPSKGSSSSSNGEDDDDKITYFTIT